MSSSNLDLIKPKFIFFGTSRLSVIVLKELAKHGLIPEIIITTPDQPKGRKLVLTPMPTKEYGQIQNIPVYEFAKLDNTAIENIKTLTDGKNIDFFLVASYGLIIPQAILDMPSFGTINIHPSLLPKYRGATPIQQAILDNTIDTGVTIMLMDAKMDHGPILLQEKRTSQSSRSNQSNQNNQSDWPKKYDDLEEELAIQASNLLALNIDKILNGEIKPTPQNHDQATFTKKISKSDGQIDIEKLHGDEGFKQFLKFNAFATWPTCYFFVQKNGKEMRVKITDAIWQSSSSDTDPDGGEMKIIKVIPEGQKEVDYSEFLKRL